VKVVLDTNVLVSGLLSPKGAPGRIVSAWDDSRFELVLAFAQLEEMGRVLAYPRIRSRTRWTDEDIGRFLEQIYLRAHVIDAPAAVGRKVRDPGDAPILAAFLSSGADVLVSGDDDLLSLRTTYAIETPAEFVKRL
jgi:putative PIN family toxin of toxin-antitoxin system